MRAFQPQARCGVDVEEKEQAAYGWHQGVATCGLSTPSYRVDLSVLEGAICAQVAFFAS